MRGGREGRREGEGGKEGGGREGRREGGGREGGRGEGGRGREGERGEDREGKGGGKECGREVVVEERLGSWTVREGGRDRREGREKRVEGGRGKGRTYSVEARGIINYASP